MANLEPRAKGGSGIGFDPDNGVLVIGVGESYKLDLAYGDAVDLYLEEPNDGAVKLDPPGPAKGDETHRPFAVTGKKPGSATLHGVLSRDLPPWPKGSRFIQPLSIRVVNGTAGNRQAFGGHSIHEDFRKELVAMNWRDAVLRVAFDQMYSKNGTGTSAAARPAYDEIDENWCGAFVVWCYDVLAKAKGSDSPFGRKFSDSCALRSGIKALAYAIQYPEKFTIYNYTGADRYGGAKTTVAFKPVTPGAIQRGDVCLTRDEHGVFRHVCMVYEPPKDANGSFSVMNGNAGDASGAKSAKAGPIALSYPANASESWVIRSTKWEVKNRKGEVEQKSNPADSVGDTAYHYLFLHINDW
ncbi:hypothetical protein [Zavarzinia compransoris]|uniref:Uncharacterized protein n=1 Tax=Zavarzinia compransoris TaxID=1264899 RepID=A0A317E9H3_9PROT|nr:hypothetical protein [Zavarzinia compransoris]PWR23232.1 hypothetical protein DKG75_01270 [Zavarzinia compransoris]TDP46208.1 hypothetical protein DES42_104294 [Zavarzinia compransoris]